MAQRADRTAGGANLTIFFFVMLYIVAIIRVLMGKGSHFEPMSTTAIAVGSLILGKAVLIADMLPAF
jgi:hypothetical protein